MDTTFDPTECRVVGALIEKSLSTPDHYPLTLNALVAACNQKSNRDPVTSYEDFEIEGTLRSLFMKDWVTNTDVGGRTLRWKHRVEEQLGLGPGEQAVLAELLLRGPQQPGELRARANRMSPIASQAELQAVLEGLRSRAFPLVRNLGRRSGERSDRWAHTLTAEGAPPATPEAHAPAPSDESEPPTPAPPDLEARVAALERTVAALGETLEGLRRSLGDGV